MSYGAVMFMVCHQKFVTSKGTKGTTEFNPKEIAKHIKSCKGC